jgi:hypothetical protein
VPSVYFEKYLYEWNGDKTYNGLVEYVKGLQLCIEKYGSSTDQLKIWNENQKKSIEDMKKKYNIE